MRFPRNHTFLFYLLGRCFKGLFAIMFGLLVGCWMLVLFGFGNIALGILDFSFPWLVKSLLTLIAGLAINALFEAL
ncbi:MAG: hypothetical protein AAF579_01905 [Cyanobacteria bacterium P01_C01_bin.118]